MSHDLVLAASEVPWFYNLIFFPSWAMLHYSVLTVLILWVIWSTGKNWVTIIKVRYDHYHNKSCSSILGQIVRLTCLVGAQGRMPGQCCWCAAACSTEMDSELFKRHYERNTVSTNIYALIVNRIKMRCRANRLTCTSVLSVFSLSLLLLSRVLHHQCMSEYRTKQYLTDQGLHHFWTAQRIWVKNLK